MKSDAEMTEAASSQRFYGQNTSHYALLRCYIRTFTILRVAASTLLNQMARQRFYWPICGNFVNDDVRLTNTSSSLFLLIGRTIGTDAAVHLSISRIAPVVKSQAFTFGMQHVAFRLVPQFVRVLLL